MRRCTSGTRKPASPKSANKRSNEKNTLHVRYKMWLISYSIFAKQQYANSADFEDCELQQKFVCLMENWTVLAYSVVG